MARRSGRVASSRRRLLSGGLVAAVAIGGGLAAGCGDDEAESPATVTVQAPAATVTVEAPPAQTEAAPGTTEAAPATTPGPSATTSPEPPTGGAVTVAEAEAAAVRAIEERDGQSASVTFRSDEDDYGARWEIEVTRADGAEFDVYVDAAGNVVRIS